MKSYVREYDGEKYPRDATSSKVFVKLADTIADPPAAYQGKRRL
jgi:hypothetical protein